MRTSDRTSMVDLDVVNRIKKVYNGNMTKFYNEYVKDSVYPNTYYFAIQMMNPCTEEVAKAIERAHDTMLIDKGLNDNTTDLLMPLTALIERLSREMDSLTQTSDIPSFVEKYSPSLRFLDMAIKDGTIKLKSNKKSRLI